jgi:predicted AlkP superfamily pyrophosphatase or phosphodiesterase
MKSCALVALSVAVLFSSLAPAQGRRENPRPKLVVVLVVDQMRADYVEKYGHHWTRGLRRLIAQGAWFRQAAYPYWTTHTCAGHATISTGSLPATHGIMSNTWWDRESARIVTCTEDAQTQTISYGSAVKGGDSPVRLEIPTFSDELRAQAGGKSRVVTVSIKARSAIMLAGHRADAATWHDEKTGAWLTSTAYADSPVPFVAQYVKEHPVEADFGKSWTRALPEPAYAFEGTTLGEKPPAGWDTKFPHVLKGAGEKPDAAFYQLWEKSPFADVYLGRMTQTAVDALGLGKGRDTDFLGVSFSTLDLIGHAYGPFSQEVQDELVRLDETIGELLGHLDRVVGFQNYVVALSADHGVAPIPEQMSGKGFNAGRLPTAAVVDKVEKALERFLGSGKHVARMVTNDLYFAPGVYQKLQANPTAMQAALDAALSVPGVGRVLRSDELGDRRAIEDPIVRAAARSYFPGRSGDLFVLEKPYWLLDIGFSLGTDHGTAYAYDTRVPLLLMGRGIRPGEYLTAATPADIAPTLAFLCGVTLARSDGRVLAEALAVPAPLPPQTPSPKR